MIWVNGRCKVADNLFAGVQEAIPGQWFAYVEALDTGDPWSVWDSEYVPTEAAAKAAVCHWIGKTMAQFSNALAAGYERPDDGA